MAINPWLHRLSGMNGAQRRNDRGPTAAVSATREKDRQEPARGETELAKDVSAPAVHGSLAHGPRQTNQFQQQNANTFQIPARAQNAPETKQELRPPTATGGSGASEMVEVQSESAQLDVQSRATDSVVAANKPSPQPVSPSASDGEVSRAKSAPAAAPAQAAPSALEIQGSTFQALQFNDSRLDGELGPPAALTRSGTNLAGCKCHGKRRHWG